MDVRAAVLVALLLLLGVGDGSAGTEAVSSLRVLFVGNSLTAANDLPALVAELARHDGHRLTYRTIAPGGYSLEDHWNQGDARRALESRSWDVVVMQQGPSALPESQANLREWATRFAAEARAHGTRPALLTVWPESYRRSALRDVVASYARAAAAARAELLPAGLAWRLAWRCDPGFGLYGRDGFHPSLLGTYTAALDVYGLLFRTPLASAAPPSGIATRDTRLARWAAAASLGRRLPTRRRCGRVSAH